MMYESQFQKIYPYDWFGGPGSHIINSSFKKLLINILYDYFVNILKGLKEYTVWGRYDFFMFLKEGCIYLIKIQ